MGLIAGSRSRSSEAGYGSAVSETGNPTVPDDDDDSEAAEAAEQTPDDNPDVDEE